MRKNKNRKRRTGRGGIKQLRLVKPIIDSPMRRDINLQFQVYAIYNFSAGVTLYSFSSSTSQVLPTLRQDLGASLLAATEYIRYQGDFALYRWYGLSIIPSNNIFNSSDLSSVPPLFYRVAPHVTGTVTADGVGRSDNAIETKITNFGRLQPSYHPFPPALYGTSGNIVGGSQAYLPTTLNIATNLELQIGNITNPDFVSASSKAVKILTFDVICKVEFCSPYVQ